MRKIILLVLLGVFYGCVANAQKKKTSKKYKIEKTELEWKNILTEEQYYILREAGTERPFTHPYNNNKANGTYVCAGCGSELFSSDTKFNSGTGWPSFWDVIKDKVELKKISLIYNLSLFYNKT